MTRSNQNSHFASGKARRTRNGLGRPEHWQALLSTTSHVAVSRHGHGLGIASLALGLALAANIGLPTRAYSQPLPGNCTTTGSISAIACDNTNVYFKPIEGSTSLSVSGLNINGGGINYFPDDNSTLGPFTMSLTVDNTSIHVGDYGGINVAPKPGVISSTVTVGSDVDITNVGGFGGIWVRNETSGDVIIDSGAEINSTGSDGINGVTNGGSVSLTNSGHVTSTTDRGLYADGSAGGASTDTVTVNVNNSGIVDAQLAGIRAIDYSGKITIENSGYVTSEVKQAIIGWSPLGEVEIRNSGTAISHGHHGLQAAVQVGDATITNSGLADSQTTAAGFNGVYAASGFDDNEPGSGDVEVTNTKTGLINSAGDSGIFASSPKGDVSVVNYGTVTGVNGVDAKSADGLVGLGNDKGASIAATSGFGVSLDGTENLLINYGSISTGGTVGVQTGNGDSTVVVSGTIAAATEADTAIAMGSGNNRLVLADTAKLVGKVTNAGSHNTLELTGSAAGTLDLGTVGDAGSLQGFSKLDKSGSGLWTVTGTGGSLTDSLAVSEGTMALDGTVSVSDLTVGSEHAAELQVKAGADLTSANATIGTEKGGVATLSVSGKDAQWTNTFDMTIGKNGGKGSVTVSKGGRLVTHRVGVSTGSWEAGQGGSGELTVTGKGTVWTNDGGVDIARSAGSTGKLTVSDGAVAKLYGNGIYAGAGSEIVFTGKGTRVEIGNPEDNTAEAWLSPGGGTVTVSDGASVYTSGTYVGPGDGNSVSSVDTVTMTVTGAGTSLDATERLYVGGQNGGDGNGNGILTIADGATATTATLGVGMDLHSSGTLVVTGKGSSMAAKANANLDALGNIYVGYLGLAAVTVSDGATLSADNDIRIGWEEGSKGTLTLSDGAKLSAAAIKVGNVYGSEGTLNIGAAAGQAAAAAGTISAKEIYFGEGNSKLVLNHTDTDFKIASNITGEGQLVVLNGTSVLTGTNSYGYGTIISGGTLQIGDGGTSGSIEGVVKNNSVLAIDRSDDFTFGNHIGGTGSVVMSGSGTLTLSDHNTYSGGTTLADGTLSLNSVFNIGTGGLTFDGGTLTTTRNIGLDNSISIRAGGGTIAAADGKTITLVSDIKGTGSLEKTGNGTLVLTGSNSYSGGTTISAGTLSATTQSLGGNVINNADLLLDQDFDGTFAGNISGSGNLTKDGTGTVEMTGTLTYTGSTTVLDGRLIGNTTTVGGPVVNSGVVNFDQKVDGTYSSVISGSGSLVKTGKGVLTLTGANSYSGGTTVSAGTLVVSSNSLPGNVVNNAALVFNQNSIGTFGGVISGSGTLAKTGTGNLILTGSSTVGGGTTVSGGQLTVNGSLGGSVLVSSGATLGGTGTFGSLTIGSGGTLSAGSSGPTPTLMKQLASADGAVGTLSVAGDVTFLSGSTLAVDVTAEGAADLVDASGKAVLSGGTVAVNAGSGAYQPKTTYTILSADGGVNGTFTSATSNFAFLTPELSYDANDVYLTLLRNNITFASLAETDNQRNVATVAETLGWNDDVYKALVNLKGEEAASAFDSLTGEIHSDVAASLLDRSRMSRDAVNNRIREAFGDIGPNDGTSATKSGLQNPGVWMTSFGAWDRYDSDGNGAAVSANGGGFLIGADAFVSDHWQFGLATGYGRDTIDNNSLAASADVDSVYLSAYGGTTYGPASLRFGAIHTMHQIDSSRSVDFTGYKDSLSADYDAATSQIFAEGSWRFDFDRLQVEPYANLAYVHVKADGFGEKGSAAALSSTGSTYDQTYSTLGLRVEQQIAVGSLNGALQLGLGWRHAFDDVTASTGLSFASSDVFSVASTATDRDAALVDVGFKLGLTPSADLSLRYSGQFGESTRDQSVSAKLGVKF